MNSITAWPRLLAIVGFVLMLIGAIDPLEGAIVIVAGSGLVAAGAVACGSRHRRLLSCAFGLLILGVVAMVALSAVGGIGGRHGVSWWWAIVLVPYPAGFIAGLVGAIFLLIDFRKPSVAA